MTFVVTFEGMKTMRAVVKYDRIEIRPNVVSLMRGNKVVARMPTPRADLDAGDSLTLTGIKGKLEVEVTE